MQIGYNQIVKPTNPLVFRIDPELWSRLEKCAKSLKLKKYQLAILAMEAAAEAIEENDYRLVLPIEFSVKQVPAEASPEPESVAGAVADHLLKRNIVDVVKASSGEAEPGASGPGHTSGKDAPASTAGQASAPGQESPSPSGQTKASGRASKRKRTRSGHKP